MNSLKHCALYFFIFTEFNYLYTLLMFRCTDEGTAETSTQVDEENQQTAQPKFYYGTMTN